MDDNFENVNERLGVLLEYKDSAGHKAMVELANQQMSLNMMEFMDGPDDVDLVQLRARFKAWKGVVEVLGQQIFSYESYIRQVMEEREREMQKGMTYGRI
jgi:uncharacterized protein YbaP (TraB family)